MQFFLSVLNGKNHWVNSFVLCCVNCFVFVCVFTLCLQLNVYVDDLLTFSLSRYTCIKLRIYLFCIIPFVICPHLCVCVCLQLKRWITFISACIGWFCCLAQRKNKTWTLNIQNKIIVVALVLQSVFFLLLFSYSFFSFHIHYISTYALDVIHHERNVRKSTYYLVSVVLSMLVWFFSIHSAFISSFQFFMPSF